MESQSNQENQSQPPKEALTPSQKAEKIHSELSKKRDLDQSRINFLSGDSFVRDVSGYTKNIRDRILFDGIKITGRGLEVKDQSVLGFCELASNNLSYVMKNPHKFQEYPGFHFLKRTQSLIENGMPSAKILDKCFEDVTGHDIKALLSKDKAALGFADIAYQRYILKIASDPKYFPLVGYFLAERSVANERLQNGLYSKELAEAKINVFDKFRYLASQYNLPQDHVGRTEKQIEITQFSAFDHLFKHSSGITIVGDYDKGSHRVEIKFGGSPGNFKSVSQKEVTDILLHEIWHSAQAQDAIGIGLRTEVMDRLGESANEGLVEYLTQITGDSNGLGSLSDTSDKYKYPYPVGVKSMHQLDIKDNDQFAALFRASFGHIQPELKPALQKFYVLYDQIKRKK